MNEALSGFLQAKGIIIAVAFVALFIAERKFPVATWVGGMKRVGRNLLLAGFNFLASPLIVIPLTAYAASHSLDWRPSWWSGWLGLGLDLALLDFWIYWWHRATHRFPLLWRFHEVHHLDEMLDTTSALRFHFGEVLLSSLVRALLIFLLDMPLSSVIVFEAIVVVSTLFHHSNMKLPQGFENALSQVVVTPSIHWVHHHARRSDTDSNYATVLSVWDRLFASRSRTPRSADMAIGVEMRPEKTIGGLVARPFRQD